VDFIKEDQDFRIGHGGGYHHLAIIKWFLFWVPSLQQALQLICAVGVGMNCVYCLLAGYQLVQIIKL
jgi:hypothetical protein